MPLCILRLTYPLALTLSFYAANIKTRVVCGKDSRLKSALVNPGNWRMLGLVCGCIDEDVRGDRREMSAEDAAIPGALT